MNATNTLEPVQSDCTRVRRFRALDLLRFIAYRSDAELAWYQSWLAMTDSEAHTFVEEMASITGLLAGEWIQLAIADASTDELIGDLGLFLSADESEAEVGFTLCHAAQGRGHATRALTLALSLFFDRPTMQRVRGVTDARNVGSIRVLERARFIKVAEQAAVFKGEQCREFVYECRRVNGWLR